MPKNVEEAPDIMADNEIGSIATVTLLEKTTPFRTGGPSGDQMTLPSQDTGDGGWLSTIVDL